MVDSPFCAAQVKDNDVEMVETNKQQEELPSRNGRIKLWTDEQINRFESYFSKLSEFDL